MIMLCSKTSCLKNDSMSLWLETIVSRPAVDSISFAEIPNKAGLKLGISWALSVLELEEI